MKVAIIGGGIMGLSLGYFLTQTGAQVEIFEASRELGGLAGPLVLPDGTPVDRFYHAILSSDGHLRELCEELGLADQLRFRQTRMGFYYRRQVYSMNSTMEFLRFPPLRWIDRGRLGLTVAYAQTVRDWRSLERVSVEEWLVRLSGRRTYENIWRPMLRAKFDGDFANVPATYIWSRLVRMKSTREGAGQREEAGHLIGGYITLLNAMAAKIQAAGGQIHLSCPVNEIVIEGQDAVAPSPNTGGERAARGVRVGGEIRTFDAVVATVQAPIFRKLIPAAPKDYHDYLGQTSYLGIIAPLLVLSRPLTGYWTINITDDGIPFTGIIETTAYIDPQYVGGHHLVYLPKYTAPGSNLQSLPDDRIQEIWLDNLQQMFPDFDRSTVRYFVVGRERYVEPLHGLSQTYLIPSITTPVSRLYLATTAQIYPALTNGESVTRHARETAETVLAGFKPEPADAGVGRPGTSVGLPDVGAEPRFSPGSGARPSAQPVAGGE